MTLRCLRHITLLWLLLVCVSTTVFSAEYSQVFGTHWNDVRQYADYSQVFGTHWTDARQYVDGHHSEWTHIFEEFGIDSRIAEAIVFPELIRYNRWHDQLEKAAVNGLYVTRGTTGANFSVGRFQMKPSFAEEVEQAWNRSRLSSDYGFVFNLQANSEARRSRIRRLSDVEGQCRYLSLFILLQFERLPQLRTLNSERQVAFLATLYNSSFSASWTALQRLIKQSRFHTDIIPTKLTEYYSYSDIAVAAYKELEEKPDGCIGDSGLSGFSGQRCAQPNYQLSTVNYQLSCTPINIPDRRSQPTV